jgi:RND family efflux transporter MFP subunit
VKRILASRWLLFPLMACAAAVGCTREGQQMPPPKPPEVLVGYPVTSQVTDYEDFTGRTDAIHSVDIKARATGYLNKVCFKDGADVKKGEKLFEIDPAPYLAERDRAKASVAQSQARLNRLNADLRRAEFARGRGAIAAEELEKVIGDRDEAAAGLKVSQEGQRIAELNLSYTRVLAPTDGRMTRRLVDTGNMVKADETLLTTLHKLDPMYAYFDVDERTVLRIRELTRQGKIRPMRDGKMKVFLGTSRDEGFPHEGKIDFASAFIDSSTGTQSVRGVFDNKDLSLIPGLYVRIRLPIGNPYQAVLVTEKALGTDQGRKFVYVVNEKNEAIYKPVQLGPVHKGMRVVREGLTANDWIIVSGLQRVRPGKPVAPGVEVRGHLNSDATQIKDENESLWNLDLGKDAKLSARARQFAGKPAVVHGKPKIDPKSKGPTIIVTDLKAVQ